MRLRNTPLHSGPWSAFTLPWNGSAAISVRTRATRFWIALGRPRRSCSALALNLQTQFMSYVGPWPRFPFACLFETLAQSFRLGRREHVVGVDNPPGLHEHTVTVLCERHEIPFAHVKVIENLAGNDHLAPLANAADRFPHGCTCLSCHTFRLSDYLIIRTCQGAAFPLLKSVAASSPVQQILWGAWPVVRAHVFME